MRIDDATLAILSRATIDGDKVSLTCGQLDRKDYLAVNKILEAIGGKWNRKAKAHIFDGDPTGRFESVLLTGEVTPPEKYGYFPTPPEIAKRLVELADIQPHHKVLEPSAGRGAILEHLPPCHGVMCVELLPENAAHLKQSGYNVIEWDFLDLEPKPIYDRIVANPPFSYTGHPQADVDHVMWMLEFLRPSRASRLVSVMSAGVMFRENKKTVDFRKLVKRHGYFEPLPDGAFKASGTMVRTVVAVIDNEPINELRTAQKNA